ASNQVQPWNVAVDATHVTWANKGKSRKNGGSVARAPKSGGPVEIVADKLSSPFGLALAGHTTFYTCAVVEDGCIGVDKEPFHAEFIKEPWAIAVDRETLFWTDLVSREVLAGPLTNVGEAPGFAGTRTLVAKTSGRPVGIALDDTHVYWTDSDPGVVARVSKSGGAVETIYSGGDKTVGIAVDATHVYWSEWGSGRIAKAPKGGGATVLLASDQKGARAIAIDDGRVYFTHPPSGSIKSVAKGGGAVFTHASGQKHPYAIALDATTIYWADLDAGTVMAVAK
ncbi:MAG: hypothetical protein ACXVCJ_26125, partial [Polyangiales bacterium]